MGPPSFSSIRGDSTVHADDNYSTGMSGATVANSINSAGGNGCFTVVPAAKSRSRRTLIRLAIGLLTLTLAVLCVRYSSSLFGGHRAIGQTDLLGYYSAAHLALQGHAHALYDLDTLQRAQQAAIRPSPMHDPVLPYLAPPYFAVTLGPIALLPYAVAYVVWLIFNFVLLATVLLALQRYAGLSRSHALAFGVASLAFMPVVLGLAQGQVSFLILALIAGSFFALRAEKEALAGTLLAVALIKPPFVFPFLLVLAVHRRWRSLCAFALTALFLFLAPIPLAGTGLNHTYLDTLLDVTRMQGQSANLAHHHLHIATATYDPHVNFSMAASVQLLLGSPASTLLTAALTLFLLLALAFSVRSNSSIDLAFGLATIAAVLINPHVLGHDLVLLVLPAAVALKHRAHAARSTLVLLLGAYAAIDLGGFVLSFTHLQLAVLADVALGTWLVATAHNSTARPGTTPIDPAAPPRRPHEVSGVLASEG